MKKNLKNHLTTIAKLCSMALPSIWATRVAQAEKKLSFIFELEYSITNQCATFYAYLFLTFIFFSCEFFKLQPWLIRSISGIILTQFKLLLY